MLFTVPTRVLRDRFGEKKALELIKKIGFDGVDYSFNCMKEKDYNLGDDYLEKAYNTKKILAKLKLKCFQSHAPYKVQYGDELSINNKNYRDIVRAIEYSSIIGCKYIVVHAVNCPVDVDLVKYNIDYYKTFLPFLKKFGVKICIENLYKSTSTIEIHKKVFDALDKKYYAICVDTGHSVCCGYTPEQYIKSFNKGEIKCVHIHDMDGVNDNHWIPYQGVIDWDKTLKALKEYNFSGAFNFEILHCFDNLDDGLVVDLMTYAYKVGRYMLKRYKTL